MRCSAWFPEYFDCHINVDKTRHCACSLRKLRYDAVDDVSTQYDAMILMCAKSWLEATVPELKPTCPRKRKTAGLRGISPVDGKVEELWGKGFVEER